MSATTLNTLLKHVEEMIAKTHGDPVAEMQLRSQNGYPVEISIAAKTDSQGTMQVVVTLYDANEN